MDLEHRLTGVCRAWYWTPVFAVLSILAGLAIVFWPHQTLLVVATLFALQLIAASVFRLIISLALTGESAWRRARMALLAGLALVVGVFLLKHMFLSLLVLALVLGGYWVVHGVIELVEAIGHRDIMGRGWVTVSGVMSMVAGLVVLVFPRLSLLLLTRVLGVWLVLFGVVLIVRGLFGHFGAPSALGESVAEGLQQILRKVMRDGEGPRSSGV